MPIPRAAAAKLASEQGYETKAGMSKKVDYLVMGEGGKGTTKHKKAIELQTTGHPIIIVPFAKLFANEDIDT